MAWVIRFLRNNLDTRNNKIKTYTGHRHISTHIIWKKRHAREFYFYHLISSMRSEWQTFCEDSTQLRVPILNCRHENSIFHFLKTLFILYISLSKEFSTKYGKIKLWEKNSLPKISRNRFRLSLILKLLEK